MNRILALFFGIVLVFAAAGSAGAVSYLYNYNTDTRVPVTEYMKHYWGRSAENSTISWIFDLADENSGYFGPNTQDIESASVGLTLADDNGGDWFYESAGFQVGQDVWWGEVDTRAYKFQISPTSLPDLRDTGMIDAPLTAVWGDFDFKEESTLSARNAASVPEPATIMLFGIGLVCLAGMARRRRNGKKAAGFYRDRNARDFSETRTYRESCSG